MKIDINQILDQSQVHSEWKHILKNALLEVDPHYLEALDQDQQWLPGIINLLAAFRMPLSKVQYILLGESPYPRADSANGYAFWDQAVDSLWSEKGLSKAVNRATSLRNWIKALLVARGDLSRDLSQEAIAKLPKETLCQTAEVFFNGLMEKGFLLLNASLVFSEGKVRYHAKQWQPFLLSLFSQLARQKPSIQLVLFGKIADNVPKTNLKTALVVEHPYNISFINNPKVLAFFKPFDLLATYD